MIEINLAKPTFTTFHRECVPCGVGISDKDLGVVEILPLPEHLSSVDFVKRVGVALCPYRGRVAVDGVWGGIIKGHYYEMSVPGRSVVVKAYNDAGLGEVCGIVSRVFQADSAEQLLFPKFSYSS